MGNTNTIGRAFHTHSGEVLVFSEGIESSAEPLKRSALCFFLKKKYSAEPFSQMAREEFLKIWFVKSRIHLSEFD